MSTYRVVIKEISYYEYEYLEYDEDPQDIDEADDEGYSTLEQMIDDPSMVVGEGDCMNELGLPEYETISVTRDGVRVWPRPEA